MTKPTEIAVDLQLSPCSTKIDDSTTIQAFNGELANFVSRAIEESGDFSSYDVAVVGRIESQSIHQQDGVWSRMERFFRNVYTKRLSGDAVGRSRMDVKEIFTLKSNNSTIDAATEQSLSDLIIGRFADENSARQLRLQLLASEDTKSFFSEPTPIEVVALKQNRNAGVKLAPLLGSIGVVVVLLAIVFRFSPRRWSKSSKRSSEYTSRSSLAPPELIDISNELSSIGVDSPASVYLASQEDKVRKNIGPPSAMMQELPPIPEETDYDLERGPANDPYRRDLPPQPRAYPPPQRKPQDVRAITVVVGVGYPDELGFTICPGPEALEINKVLNDSPLPLRTGDMIAEVDGQDASRWNAADFEEYLVERRRHNKILLIVRPSTGRDGPDDCGHKYDDGTRSYFTEDYETECEDETMMEDYSYYG